MRIKKTTITIEQKPSKEIILEFVIKHDNGETQLSSVIKSYPIGEKLDTIADRILETLNDCREEGYLEEESTCA